MSKWIAAPTIDDLQILAQGTGYAVRVDREGFHIRNTSTGATTVVSTADEVIDTVCRRTL